MHKIDTPEDIQPMTRSFIEAALKLAAGDQVCLNDMGLVHRAQVCRLAAHFAETAHVNEIGG